MATLESYVITVYSVGSNSMTIMEEIAKSISSGYINNSKFLTKGRDWYQAIADEFSSKASEAAANSSATGNKVYDYVSSIADDLAAKYQDDVAERN